MVRGIDSIPPEKVSIAGPAGNLVGTLESPLFNAEAAVLLLHPHPLHGVAVAILLLGMVRWVL